MNANNNIYLNNEFAELAVNLYGGLITDFHLKKDRFVNPLSFAFSKKQMPPNNRNGAPYRGHFLCLGRWGEPSKGESEAGMPNHGQIANIYWKGCCENNRTICMKTQSELEGLSVKRKIVLDEGSTIFGVKEDVTNFKPLGRLYNMVQHPTISAPFLNPSTVIECNATNGFNQLDWMYPEKDCTHWPEGKDENGRILNLRTPKNPYTSVFSYVVDRKKDFGWICTYSRRHHLLFGYVWKRTDYPWVHLWQYWDEDNLIYRGIEFGTAGIHKPFKEIIQTRVRLFGESTTDYIDAGETVTRKYLSFLYKTDSDIKAIKDIEINGRGEQMIIRSSVEPIHLYSDFKGFL